MYIGSVFPKSGGTLIKRLFWLALTIAVSLVVLQVCGGDDSDSGTSPTPSPTSPAPPPAAPSPTTPSEPTATATEAPSTSGNVVEVVNEDPGGSGQYQFSPSEFTFSVGDTVTFKVTAETEFHTFNVDDLNISQELEAGQTVEFTMTLDTAGEFHLYCVPHEALGMTGTITVN